jgi:PEP-CTERM motif
MKKFLSTTVALAAVTMAVAAPAHAAGLTTLTEGFSSVSALQAGGAWAFQNNSSPAPLSPTPWAQGFTQNAITAQAGPQTSYIYASSNSTAGDPNTGIGDISNWLITPELDFSGGGTFSFWTRTIAGEGATFFHNLEIRQSSSGSSVNVGSTALSVGDFSLTKLVVGSTDGSVLYPGNYPGDATNAYAQFTFTVAPTGGSGRIAFRSFYTGSGGSGQQGFIGVDTVSYEAAVVPEPSAALATLMLGGFGLAGGLRKSKKAQA